MERTSHFLNKIWFSSSVEWRAELHNVYDMCLASYDSYPENRMRLKWFMLNMSVKLKESNLVYQPFLFFPPNNSGLFWNSLLSKWIVTTCQGLCWALWWTWEWLSLWESERRGCLNSLQGQGCFWAKCCPNAVQTTVLVPLSCHKLGVLK